jgi:DNA-directed RNA polymerase beta subunit
MCLSHFASHLNCKGADDARYKRYSALDNDGICRVGEKLHDQSIMINREMPVEDRDELTPALPGRVSAFVVLQ